MMLFIVNEVRTNSLYSSIPFDIYSPRRTKDRWNCQGGKERHVSLCLCWSLAGRKSRWSNMQGSGFVKVRATTADQLFDGMYIEPFNLLSSLLKIHSYIDFVECCFFTLAFICLLEVSSSSPMVRTENSCCISAPMHWLWTRIATWTLLG